MYGEDTVSAIQNRAVIGTAIALVIAGGVLMLLRSYVHSDKLSRASEPKSAEAHELLGDELAKQGHFTEAILHLRKAVSLKPDFVKAHEDLGSALLMQHNFTEAISYLRRAIGLVHLPMNSQRVFRR